MENRRHHRQRKRTGEKFQPAYAGESDRGRGGDNGRQILAAALPGRSHRGLADTALARRRFFHLGAHGVQVVGG